MFAPSIVRPNRVVCRGGRHLTARLGSERVSGARFGCRARSAPVGGALTVAMARGISVSDATPSGGRPMRLLSTSIVTALALSAATAAQAQITEQSAAGADPKARPRRRDPRRREAARYARAASGRSGRDADGLGARELRARLARRPAVRERLARVPVSGRRRQAAASIADVAAAFPLAIYNRLESGFIGFAFHPEFAKNGLFYTVHSEKGARQSGQAELHAARLHGGAVRPTTT